MALFGKIELLLIEDNPGVASLIIEVLTNQRPYPNWPLTYRIQQASSLKEAFKYVSGGYWDMIILDLSLPDSQGIGTFTQILGEAKAPIFVFTGSLGDDEIENLYDLGAAKVYTKDRLAGCMSILHDIIRNCIREKRKTDKLYQLEQARLNVLRNLETACSACGKWLTPDTFEWLTPEKYLARHQIFLSHGICPEDQIKLYGNLREE